MVAKKNEIAPVADAGLPAELMQDMEQDAGRGISDNPNDVGIPYIAVLQDLSPQVKKRDEAYIDGAEVGMMFNTVTKELYPLGVEFIAVFYESAQVEWVPRDSGGGFVAKHPYDTPLVSQAQPNPAGKGAPRLPSGNDLVETRYWFGFFRPIVAEGETVMPWEPGVIAYSSTGLKVSREWVGMTKRNRIPGKDTVAPLFSRVYQVVSKLFSKNNNDWFLPVATMGRWVTGEEYGIARRFAEQAEAGGVKTADQTADGTGGVPADETVL